MHKSIAIVAALLFAGAAPARPAAEPAAEPVGAQK
jgi:hypothetical protein